MYSPASLRKFFGSATIQNGWLDTSNLYANFYMYIAIQFLFSLYALLFIYFWNYFDCGILEGLDTLYIYFFKKNLLNFYFGQNFITESIWNRTHLPYEIRRFMREELSSFFFSIYFSINIVQLFLKLYDLKKIR